MPQKNAYHAWSIEDGEKLNKYLRTLPGSRIQEYPPYSSRTVNGIPLFRWAREGKLKDIKVPSRKVNIKSIKLVKTSHISSTDLLKEVENRISTMNGDFRQDEILKAWREILSIKAVYTIKSFVISCSSGTYVRSIAQEMGKSIMKESLALSIKRTQIGDYVLEDAFGNKKPA
jgi:tRNA pseudouridine(55) synthase